jgi:hypothetical protein
MKFRKLFLILASVAVFAFVWGPAMAADTIKLAYIDPLSGGFANVGDAGNKHFQYMADLINAKGGVLGGMKFEIVRIAFIMLVDGFDQSTGNAGTISLGNEPDSLVNGGLELNQAFFGTDFIIKRDDLEFFTAQYTPFSVDQIRHVLKMLMTGIPDICKSPGKWIDVSNFDGVRRHCRPAYKSKNCHTCQNQK